MILVSLSGMAEEQDDGQAHIEPKKFKLMCMLYDQKVPKVFAQYDQPTIHREHIRQTMLLVLAQHANVAALWQVRASQRLRPSSYRRCLVSR